MPHRSQPAAPVKPLLLAGGRSTLNGLPKHLLRMPDGRPLYQHQLDHLHRACPGADSIFVSLGRESVLDGFLRDVARPVFTRPGADRAATPGPIATVYDREEARGPAAGLLAAHEVDPDAAWLVLACDRALLPAPDVLGRLRDAHAGSVTRARGPRGDADPLVAVWSPAALRELAALAAKGELEAGRDGLESVVKKCGGLVLDALEGQEQAMTMIETQSDWEEAYRLASEAVGEKGTTRARNGSR